MHLVHQPISVADFGWRVNHIKCRYYHVYKISFLEAFDLEVVAAAQQPSPPLHSLGAPLAFIIQGMTLYYPVNVVLWDVL
jgi:hypothetical protein